MSDYWEQRYRKGGNSGMGSQGQAAVWKAQRVSYWAGREVLDIGCGDGEQASLYQDIPMYTGIDPSPSAIHRATELCGTSDWQFFVHFPDVDNWFPRRTHMSIDVIYHLVEDDEYQEHMKLLWSATDRVIIYASDFDSYAGDYAPHVRHRKWSDDVPPEWGLVFREEGPGPVSDFYVFDRR